MIISVSVTTVTSANMTSWILVRLSIMSVPPLLCCRARRNLEWIGRLPGQVGQFAGQEVGRVEDLGHVHHVRIEGIRRGEERLSEPAQGEVEGGEHVEVVAAHRLLDAEVRERERQQQLQRRDE